MKFGKIELKNMSSERRNFGLDLLRSAAIISVVFFHTIAILKDAPQIVVSIFSRGWMGVDLFFVLSGFLIGKQTIEGVHLGSKISMYLKFWTRRWTRTLPLYFVALTVYLVIKPTLFNAPFIGFNWKYFFFLQNFGPMLDFGQSWSLCVEEQFYILFPIIFSIVGSKHIWFWLLPLCVSLLYRTHLSLELREVIEGGISPAMYAEIFRYKSIGVLDSISVGVFLAASYQKWSRFSMGVKLFIGSIGLATLLFTAIHYSEFPVQNYKIISMYSLLAFSFGCLLVAFESLKKPIAGLGFFHFIALWSYSAYMWHQLVVRFISRYLADSSWEFGLIAYVSIVLSVSYFSYTFIEVPGIRMRGVIEPWLSSRFPSTKKSL